MKTMSKILTVIALVVLCVSLFTLTAFAEVTKVEGVEATCTTEGTKTYYVSGVDWYWDEDCTQYIPDANDVKIPAHKDTTPPIEHAAKDPTCMKEGNDLYFECAVCGKLYKDSGLTTATTLAEVKKSKVDHEAADTEGTAEVPPTCGKDGTKAYWICQWCGQKISKASGGYLLTDLTIPATGEHDWGEWTEVSAATGTHGGEEQRVCPL